MVFEAFTANRHLDDAAAAAEGVRACHLDAVQSRSLFSKMVEAFTKSSVGAPLIVR